VLDIGANMGGFTIPFANMVTSSTWLACTCTACLLPGSFATDLLRAGWQVGPHGEVWAFEPQRILQQLLTANVALNELVNTRTFHAAVGRLPGSIAVPKVRSPGVRMGGWVCGRCAGGVRVVCMQ
jgi:hypothetical protein